MKAKLTVTFIALFIGTYVFGQEKYRVEYDYATDRLSYYLIDKNNQIIDTLRKPKIRRNSMVELRLRNVNPFAVSVSTAVNEEQVHESGGSSGFDFGGLLGQIGSLGGDKLKLNVPTTVTSRGAGLTTGGASRGEQINSKFEDFLYVTTGASSLRSTLLSNLSNPNLSKEEILKNLEEVTKMYPYAGLPDPSRNFYSYLTGLEHAVSKEKQGIVGEIESMATEVEVELNEKPMSRGERASNDQLLRNLDNTLASLETTSNQTVLEINEIKALYSALEASNFEQVYDYQLSADRMNIELMFNPTIIDGAGRSAPRELKRRNVSLVSKGGFKINTSIAMTMNNFGRSSNDFYISAEGIIGAERNDYFVPNLSTMINFYPMMSESFNVGGSFGLAIPISDNVGGINFLLGPSLFMGNKNRLSLSGGVAYGPVNRLTNGIKPGDTTELRSLENFTKTVYDFGYFFGVSFSLFDIK